MLILKYSQLGCGLVKFINQSNGNYGAIDELSRKIIIQPLYSEFRPFDGDRALVVRDGQQFEIDPSGYEYPASQSTATLSDFYFIQKADRCPNCFKVDAGAKFSCMTCNNLGFIPANLRFGDID